MLVKNNYNECLTNFACSIRKYFCLEYKHQTLSYIDKILEDKKPTNVVVILFDGMGSRILDRTLGNNSFFMKNKFKDITTVFPATTTAATTSMRTGLNPKEHGWLGWDTYIKPIDKTITLFRNSEKGKEEICAEFLKVKNKLITKTIVDEINEKGDFRAVELFPFGDKKYNNFDEMLSNIEKETMKTGKKYIYAYDNEPDSSMHDFGPDSNEVKEIIKFKNEKVEELCNKLKDTIIFVIADHGHIKVEHLFLNDYPELIDMLERTTSLEQRAVSFKVKEEFKESFKDRFDEIFENYFSLYEKEEVIENNLFGDGLENELFEDAVGDFIAIAENSNKCLVSEGTEVLISQHAGWTDDEIFVPLIIIDKTTK